jgi:hypothetical protein
MDGELEAPYTLTDLVETSATRLRALGSEKVVIWDSGMASGGP